MTEKIRQAIHNASENLVDEDTSNEMMFALLEEAAESAGSKEPNDDVWEYLEGKK